VDAAVNLKTAAEQLTLACALAVEEGAARSGGARAARVGLQAGLPLPEGRLVSFGLAGALVSGLEPGTLVTARRVVDADGTSTERQIVTGCLALLAVSLLPTLIGLAGPIYFVGAFLLGTAFVALGTRQALTPSTGAARRVLFASLLYLPVLLALLAFDKV